MLFFFPHFFPGQEEKKFKEFSGEVSLQEMEEIESMNVYFDYLIFKQIWTLSMYTHAHIFLLLLRKQIINSFAILGNL